MTETTRTEGFARIIEGARGTLVFGNGIDALTGEVGLVEDGYFLFDAFTQRHGPKLRHAVPVSSVAYFRFADDDA